MADWHIFTDMRELLQTYKFSFGAPNFLLTGRNSFQTQLKPSLIAISLLDP